MQVITPPALIYLYSTTLFISIFNYNLLVHAITLYLCLICYAAVKHNIVYLLIAIYH